MTDREKLIGVLTDSFDAQYNQRQLITPVHTADHLIANGVTFAKDTDVPSKWISVEDDKPKTKKVIDGEVYYRNVVVLTDEEIIPEKIAYYDEDFDVWFQPLDILPLRNVTHWMPLPEPPRVQGVPNGTDHV